MTANSVGCSETSNTLSAGCSETSQRNALTCENTGQCRKCRLVQKVPSRARVTRPRGRKFRTNRHFRHCTLPGRLVGGA